MIIQLLIIACVSGLLYYVVNRTPIIAPTVKQIVKLVIILIAGLMLLGVAFGKDFLPF